MGTIYDWSLWSDNNDQSDDLINWIEGQKPSTINNSARAMMQRFREYIADVGGSLVGNITVDEEGKTNKISITTASKHTEIPDGLLLRFRASATTIGPTLLSVNDLLARPVMMAIEAGYGDLRAGAIQNGGVYEVVYVVRDSGWRLGHWVLMNATYEPPPPPPVERLIAAGTIGAFAMQAVPKGWLLCDGRAVSREEYKDLFEAVGLLYGVGDGDKTFNLPDLRGVFLRGFDGGRGLDRNRQFGTYQEDSILRHRHGYVAGKGEFTYRTDPEFHRQRRDLFEQYKQEIIEADRAFSESSEGGSEEKRSRGKRQAPGEKSAEEIWAAEQLERITEMAGWGGSLLNPKSPFVKLVHRIFGERVEYPPEELLAALRLLLTHHHSFAVEPTGGIETRPRNASITFGIKH